MAPLDWTKLEDAYVKEAMLLVKKLMREYPGETFYAVALHESYRELDSRIDLPLLALNTFEAIEQHKNGPEYGQDAKWSTPDWRWINIELTSSTIRQQEKAIQDEANRGSQAQWYKTEKRFVSSMVRVCKRIYAELKSHKQTPSDFVVFFDDQDGGDELIKKCLPKRLFDKHFEQDEANTKSQNLTNIPLDQHLEALWRSGFGEQDHDAIVGIGIDAVDFLVARLKKRDNNSWVAAMCLCKIGVFDKKAVQALREEVRQQTDASAWSARALGILEDLEFLSGLAAQEKTREDAASGITAPLQVQTTQYKPLDYGPLECLLTKNCHKTTASIARELEPGSGFRDIAQGDVEEAIRGLSSPYVAIKQHAVCVLGERSLGQSKERGVGKLMTNMILPALVTALKDKHPNVRRLAILSIGEWKAKARPYKPDVEMLLKDKDDQVRRCAKYVLDGNGFF